MKDDDGDGGSGDGAAEDGQHYVDRSKIDFDPEDGLLSGTAISGETDIPGPHERGNDDGGDGGGDGGGGDGDGGDGGDGHAATS